MKPLVFLSHITEEAEVATAIKTLIEPHFLGLLDFFVSSDGESIKMGQKWLDAVSTALKTCAVQIVLCSPQSVTKPWINFEAGAAWIRDIPVIPLCHSGMTPSALPMPLSLLQAANLTDVGGMKLVVPILAQALGAKTPKVDFTDFVEKIRSFEGQYTFWAECNASFSVIREVHADIIPALRSLGVVELELPDSSISAMERVMPFLRSHQLLDLQRLGRQIGTPNGIFYGCELRKLAKLDATMVSPHFKVVKPIKGANAARPGKL
jgi:TIR domain